MSDEITLDEYRELVSQKSKAKYGNKKTPDSKGVMHDSKWEAERAEQLYILERAGEILNLKQQEKFVLYPGTTIKKDGREEKTRDVIYIADFTYQTKDGTLVVEDTKGKVTEKFSVQLRMILNLLVNFGGSRFILSHQDGTQTVYERSGHYEYLYK